MYEQAETVRSPFSGPDSRQTSGLPPQPRPVRQCGEIVRCKHVQLTYHLRNVRCTQPLTARRVVQTTHVHLAQPCEKNVADVATTKTYGQKARTASCDRRLTQPPFAGFDTEKKQQYTAENRRELHKALRTMLLW
ncbi:hypothetical protein Bbelb_064930 [Branchiostoma belcheri]|nr:hypothetical protein Bbelb_064930 [Branchiostoma belcheri]